MVFNFSEDLPSLLIWTGQLTKNGSRIRNIGHSETESIRSATTSASREFILFVFRHEDGKPTQEQILVLFQFERISEEMVSEEELESVELTLIIGVPGFNHSAEGTPFWEPEETHPDSFDHQEPPLGSVVDLESEPESIPESRPAFDAIQKYFEENQVEEREDLFHDSIEHHDDEELRPPWDPTDEIFPEFKTHRSRDRKNTGRKLLDTFGDSLRFVDFMYSEEYGYALRKVPAHMPHMINRDIMMSLQAKYPKEWEETSSHQLRKANDMQYAFSYFYYLINQPPLLSPEKLFNVSDVNHDGYVKPSRFFETLIFCKGVWMRMNCELWRFGLMDIL